LFVFFLSLLLSLLLSLPLDDTDDDTNDFLLLIHLRIFNNDFNAFLRNDVDDTIDDRLFLLLLSESEVDVDVSNNIT
jgi:hypothetical protein